jgi:hypothetical protein
VTSRSPSHPTVAPTPAHLAAPGSTGRGVETIDAGSVADLPEGTMRRVTHGDLDVLVAHTPEGIVAIDDRCPHM